MKLHDLIPTVSARTDRPGRAEGAVKPVVVSGPPLVSLLPREILDASSRRSLHRSLLVSVGGVALITGAVIAASSLAATDAHSRLDDESAMLARLNAQVAKFGDVQRQQQRIALGEAAVTVAGSTAIDWRTQIEDVQGTMPADFTLRSVDATSAAPAVAFQQSPDPLDPPQVATMTITAVSRSMDSLPLWLRELRSLSAYGSATPKVTGGADSDAEGYQVVITLRLDQDAFIGAAKEKVK